MPSAIKSVRGCQRALANGKMKARCRSCVTRPHTHAFHPNNPRGRRCLAQALATQPKPLPKQPAARIFHNRAQCSAIGIITMRNRCFACVTRPTAHKFVSTEPQGRRCISKVKALPRKLKPQPKPAARVFHNRSQCSAITIATLRNRCIACTTRPRAHKFVSTAPQGRRCQPKAAVTPRKQPKPARVIFNRRGCKSKVSISTTRARCLACVTRSRPHKFFPEARQGQRCQPR